MMLTVTQVAKRLGVSAQVVYKLCAAKEIRHARIGNGRGVIRIDEASLEAYIDQASTDATGDDTPTIRRRPVNLKHFNLG